MDKYNYSSASLFCKSDPNGELLHPEDTAEAVDLYQTFLSSGDTPFQVRLDAVQKKTCFFHTEGTSQSDLSDIDMPVESEILQVTNHSVILDICLGSLNADVDRAEPRFSVCRVNSIDENPNEITDNGDNSGAGDGTGDNTDNGTTESPDNGTTETPENGANNNNGTDESQGFDPLPESDVISIMVAKQAGTPYLWGLGHQELGPDFPLISVNVDNLLGKFLINTS